MNRIYAITPFTLLDYPGELACISWIAKCNLRCVYCHNPDIIKSSGSVSDAEFIKFLEKRRQQLTGVVFSGGEATFHPNLEHLMAESKSLGYKVKLDTNGTNPKVIRNLLSHNLLDYVSLDYKCPEHLTKRLVGTDNFLREFRDSLPLLIDANNQDNILLDIRTTYYSEILNETHINQIIEDLVKLNFAGLYTIQNIVSIGVKTFGNIPKISKTLDKSKITISPKFQVKFTNF